MPKYKVTAFVNADYLEIGDQIEIDENDTIEVIEPKFEAGWYRDLEDGDDFRVVDYWDLDEIESYGTDYKGRTFGERMVRMNPPTSYEASKYKDGYYEMSDGYLYRRLDGIWSFQSKITNEWILSDYNDDNIESESGETIKRVDE